MPPEWPQQLDYTSFSFFQFGQLSFFYKGCKDLSESTLKVLQRATGTPKINEGKVVPVALVFLCPLADH